MEEEKVQPQHRGWNRQGVPEAEREGAEVTGNPISSGVSKICELLASSQTFPSWKAACSHAHLEALMSRRGEQQGDPPRLAGEPGPGVAEQRVSVLSPLGGDSLS